MPVPALRRLGGHWGLCQPLTRHWACGHPAACAGSRSELLPLLRRSSPNTATLAASPTGAAASTRNPVCSRQKHRQRRERGKGADERKDSFLTSSRPRSPSPRRPQPRQGEGAGSRAAAVLLEWPPRPADSAAKAACDSPRRAGVSHQPCNAEGLPAAARHQQLPTSPTCSERSALVCLSPHRSPPAFSSAHCHFIPLLTLHFLSFSFL